MLREDSHCGLLENSCDNLSDDDALLFDDEEIEYYFDGETIIPRKCNSVQRNRIDETETARHSVELSSTGCLPCTPSPSRSVLSKKLGLNKVEHHDKPLKPTASTSATNWCCGVVVSSPRKSKSSKLQ